MDKTILLVEENPDDEVLTRRTLKKNGVGNEVGVARDGAFVRYVEAVRQLGLYKLVLDETPKTEI